MAFIAAATIARCLGFAEYNAWGITSTQETNDGLRINLKDGRKVQITANAAKVDSYTVTAMRSMGFKTLRKGEVEDVPAGKLVKAIEAALKCSE